MLDYKLRIVKRDNHSYWCARFYIGGSERVERILGNVEYTTEPQAVALADKLGRNPRALLEKKRGRPASSVKELLTPKKRRGHTFESILPEALKAIRESKVWKDGSKSEHQWSQTLYDYAVPVLGKLDVRAIGVKEVLEVLRPIWRDRTETASKLRNRIEAVLSYAILMRYREGPNPAVWRGNLELLLPAKDRVHHITHFEAPTIDELKVAVAYCRTHPSAGSGFLLMMIATASRVTPVRYLALNQIQGDVWTVPDGNMKTQQLNPFRVPLSSLAMEALAWANDGDLAFSARGGPLSADTPRLRLQRIIGRTVTAHGIRSTFKDWCVQNDVPEIVSEKALAHVYGDKVMNAYQRDDLLEKRRVLMQRWADVFNED